MGHLSRPELEAGLFEIMGSPEDHGRVELIVRRPGVDLREVLPEGVLDTEVGLVGDTWLDRSLEGPGGSPDPSTQVTVINARLSTLVAGGATDRRALSGDQLHLDLDISIANLPPGTRLQVGSAVIEVSDEPHTGCSKFSKRFGLDAVRFVNSDRGRKLRLRGLLARVVEGGVVRVGDPVTKQTAPE